MNLWILTEERPKKRVLKTIIERYSDDNNREVERLDDMVIVPDFAENRFIFQYHLEGIKIDGIDKVNMKLISGNGSFVDYLVFEGICEPAEGSGENCLYAIEETKTTDLESRNTGIFQRATKFVSLNQHRSFSKAKRIMLYNDEMPIPAGREPSESNIIGSRMLKTLGIEILGRDTSSLKPFATLDELIRVKQKQRKPPRSNTAITITKFESLNKIVVTGKLDKKGGYGKITNDPNMGQLSSICAVIRHLGWKGKIIIDDHNISQPTIDASVKNKFLKVCKNLGIDLQGITLSGNLQGSDYWHYEKNSEKIATIFLHIVAEEKGMRGIFQNHAGCEKSYFAGPSGELVTTEKGTDKIKKLPDLVLDIDGHIEIIEGKNSNKLSQALSDISQFGQFEGLYVKAVYPTAETGRSVVLTGGKDQILKHEDILLQINKDGLVMLNSSAPQKLRDAFSIVSKIPGNPETLIVEVK